MSRLVPSEVAAALVGRPLRLAEEAIDVVRLDDSLNAAKDELEQAIRDEMLRAVSVWITAGGRPSLRVTDAMRAPLQALEDLGREEAWNELDRLGYPVAGRAGRSFEIEEGRPDDRDVEAYLRRNLVGLEVRIEEELVRADLAELSSSALAHALLRIPGGRDIASRIVSTALVNGLGLTFDQVAAEGLVGGWEYTAVLDGGTCDRCAPLDGTRYATLEELFRVLPDFGPNPRCLGGGRCRCRAVPIPFGETA